MRMKLDRLLLPWGQGSGAAASSVSLLPPKLTLSAGRRPGVAELLQNRGGENRRAETGAEGRHGADIKKEKNSCCIKQTHLLVYGRRGGAKKKKNRSCSPAHEDEWNTALLYIPLLLWAPWWSPTAEWKQKLNIFIPRRKVWVVIERMRRWCRKSKALNTK